MNHALAVDADNLDLDILANNLERINPTLMISTNGDEFAVTSSNTNSHDLEHWEDIGELCACLA